MSKLLIFFIYILFFFFIPVTFSQPEDKSEQKYECDPKIHDLKVGEEIILCIHILSLNKKFAMPIKVDEYSMVSFNSIYDLILDTEIELIAQIGDTITSMPTVRN